MERLNGKDQSFMTAYAFSFFRNLNRISLIPVTSRSEPQFLRLTFSDAFRIRCAIVCNGGKLLLDGEEDPEWTEETMNRASEDLQDLERLGEQMRKLCGSEIRIPEKYYYYTGTDEPEKICEVLKSLNRHGNIRIEHDHRKVYLFPESVNKGSAVRRFIRRFRPDVTVGAGDSPMDVPMLNEVDHSLAPSGLSGYLHGPDVRILPEGILSDQICSELGRMCECGIL